MSDILRSLLSSSVLAFAVCSTLSVGLGYTVRQILEPLREAVAVFRAVAANFVMVPLLAVAITRLLPLAPGLEIGVILLGCAAGAPFLIKLTQTAKGDVARGATLLVLLVPLSVVFMPFAVPWLAPEAEVHAGPIAGELLVTLMLPLIIGLVVRAKSSRTAQRLRPLLGKSSTLALVVLLVTTVALNLHDILAVGLRAILAALMLIVGAFVIGYVVARRGRGRRTVLGLGTAQRGISAAMLVASESIPDPDALVMVVIASVVSMVVLFPVAHWLRKPSGGTAPPANIAVARVGRMASS
jgi:BASS family bile acid:Na+ symporter